MRSDPKVHVAVFDTICARSGRPIKKGEKVVYQAGEGLVSLAFLNDLGNPEAEQILADAVEAPRGDIPLRAPRRVPLPHEVAALRSAESVILTLKAFTDPSKVMQVAADILGELAQGNPEGAQQVLAGYLEAR